MNSGGYLIDFWYDAHLPIESTPLSDLLTSKFGNNISSYIMNNTILRAAAFSFYSRKFSKATPNWPKYGLLTCIFQSIFRNKNIVMMECIDFSDLHLSTTRTKILNILIKYIFGPAMRRSVISMQAMSQWEKERFSQTYGIDMDRIHVIPWPLNYKKPSVSKQQKDEMPYVFASGRAGCDWETFYQASTLGSWPVKIVCTQAEADRIARMDNGRNRVVVLSDIPEDEHNALMANAAVCVISLRERYASTGQIRLGTAIALRVPVVASNVRGLEGYLIDGVTAKATPVGDPQAMAQAIDMLFHDRESAQTLVNAATAHSENLTSEDYFERLSNLVALSKTSAASA